MAEFFLVGSVLATWLLGIIVMEHHAGIYMAKLDAIIDAFPSLGKELYSRFGMALLSEGSRWSECTPKVYRQIWWNTTYPIKLKDVDQCCEELGISRATLDPLIAEQHLRSRRMRRSTFALCLGWFVLAILSQVVAELL